MSPKREYVKPELVIFDLNVEPLSAACCNTQDLWVMIQAKSTNCSAACCPKQVPSA